MASVSLSSINRAALSAKEGYWWINAAGLALSLLIAKMSFTAYGADLIDKAWVCITCQGLAIALAITARRALTAQMGFSAFVAGAGAAGCAWWASHGLALAWASGGDTANAWMVFFLTALEPGIFLLAEHVKEGREALRKAQEKADQEDAEALAVARAKDAETWAKPSANRATGEGATIHRLRAVENDRQPVDQPGEAVEPPAPSTADRLVVDPSDDQPVDRPVEPEHSARTFADPDAHARHLITAENVRHRNELARRVRGLTTYRAAQLLDELAPGWRSKTAAA